MGGEWNEKRALQIAIAISVLQDSGHEVNSQKLSRELQVRRPDLGELSEHDRAEMCMAPGISEIDVLVLRGLDTLKLDGIITATTCEISEWPHVGSYGHINLTQDGRRWIEVLRESTVPD